MEYQYNACLNEIMEMVLATRSRIGGKWLTPGIMDSLRFAVTEAAEALDAELRTDPRWARNNDAKQSSVSEELADCAIMLVTARYYMKFSGEETGWRPEIFNFGLSTEDFGSRACVEVVCLSCSLALIHCYNHNIGSSINEINLGLLWIIQLVPDLVGAVRNRLARLEAKWGTPPTNPA